MQYLLSTVTINNTPISWDFVVTVDLYSRLRRNLNKLALLARAVSLRWSVRISIPNRSSTITPISEDCFPSVSSPAVSVDVEALSARRDAVGCIDRTGIYPMVPNCSTTIL
jgi:hypothetical protein